jgi:DNA-binding MarR family transcriptional regulator
MDPIAEARRQWQEHGWTEAAAGMAMVTSLVRATQLVMERIEAVLRPLDLSFARYEVLQLLAFTRSGGMPMARLGSLLQVHPTSVTSAVVRLERQGHVERLKAPTDGRVVLATITASGREAVRVATEGLNRAVFEAPGLPLGEVEQLTALLTALRRTSGDPVG